MHDDKILLILDLDETLIYASERPLDRPADFCVFDYYVYKRPHLEAFLRTCNRHFALAVWSSADDAYVEAVVKHIVPPEIRLAFVWGRSRCTHCFDAAAFEAGGHANHYDHYNYLKVLKKVKRRGYSLNRVLIVDDTPGKARRNYGNVIYPKEYLGEAAGEELTHLLSYLLQLKDAENVRTLEKRNWRNKLMSDKQINNPLHGVTLETIVTQLVTYYGWPQLGARIDIRCFNENPSIKSSLTFLRKTPWARKKVEDLYLESLSKFDKK
ncbi:MAG: hypothetical protein AVDCRST_MAG56-3817 [uncultured Cytophagales bacterium]|uniref:FCP1 homology domain-containing protein n=1 Tax=uncultured Cytophagales bacterium TaxID=158755 RepID=A0A6J4JM54_9SPHI|nr:MAG: hypothetical protein AVDCRST_MAG56-3817 [uncultured Cytophagales bacterium]